MFPLGDEMKCGRRLLVFVFLLYCVNCCLGQGGGPSKTVVVRAGHLLDVKSGKMLMNQTIVIQGDKIASVGANAETPAGAMVIDLSNATVLPGLIDAHTHLTFTTNFGYSRLGVSIPREALTGRGMLA